MSECIERRSTYMHETNSVVKISSIEQSPLVNDKSMSEKMHVRCKIPTSAKDLESTIVYVFQKDRKST